MADEQLILSENARPFVTREFGVKRSGSTRKKLRQDWNRLSALGAVDIVNERTPDAVREAFEVFLALEADSWKGAQGTALLCDEKDAGFVRRLVSGLAGQGDASVALLRVDGVAIAAQVLMYCGTMAYTWKTAFNSDYAKYSPGALLIDKVTEEIFATPGIDAIEFLLRGGKLHGPALDGTPQHGRFADRRRPRKIAGFHDGGGPAVRIPPIAGLTEPAARRRLDARIPRKSDWPRRADGTAFSWLILSGYY